MNSKVKIEVFGIARDPKTGQNSLSLEKYFSLVRYLEASDVVSKVDLHFIDITKTAMINYPAVQRKLQEGHPIPIVVIDGVVKYYSIIPYEKVYQDIKRILAAK